MTNNEQEAGGWDQSDKVSNVLDNMTGVERNLYIHYVYYIYIYATLLHGNDPKKMSDSLY